MNSKGNVLALISIALMLLSIGLKADKKVFLDADLNLFSSSDIAFRDIYGTAVSPEIAIGYRFSKQFFVKFGTGWFSGDGTTAILGEETSSKHSVYSLRAGYCGSLNDALGYRAAAGICAIHYEETAMGIELNGNRLGLILEGNLLYHLNAGIDLRFGLGYMAASDTIEDETLELGGFRVGLGISLNL